jgi:hypothetical protein
LPLLTNDFALPSSDEPRKSEPIIEAI